MSDSRRGAFAGAARVDHRARSPWYEGPVSDAQWTVPPVCSRAHCRFPVRPRVDAFQLEDD